MQIRHRSVKAKKFNVRPSLTRVSSVRHRIIRNGYRSLSSNTESILKDHQSLCRAPQQLAAWTIWISWLSSRRGSRHKPGTSSTNVKLSKRWRIRSLRRDQGNVRLRIYSGTQSTRRSPKKLSDWTWRRTSWMQIWLLLERLNLWKSKQELACRVTK